MCGQATQLTGLVVPHARSELGKSAPCLSGSDEIRLAPIGLSIAVGGTLPKGRGALCVLHLKQIPYQTGNRAFVSMLFSFSMCTFFFLLSFLNYLIALPRTHQNIPFFM